MSRMPSVMSHSFSQVPRADIPRSSFDRSSGLKTAFNSGYLVPIFVDEALPGDTFKLDMTALARLATPVVPVMDNLFLDTFFFAVPVRLVWNNWQAFNGEQLDPDSSTDFLVPQVAAPATTGFAEDSLWDFLGIPPGIPDIEVSALFSRAYNLIWNEWFRDQNLQESVVVDKDDGPDDPADYVLLRRGKRHDYFTSALPWPQKGAAVTLPLGESAPVYSLPFDGAGSGNLWMAREGDGTRQDGGIEKGASNASFFVMAGGNWDTTPVASSLSLAEKDIYDDYPSARPPYADLSDATASTINALRQAFQLQKLFERDARGGTRYTEIIRSHFGVISPDARLQRPEYLGGGSQSISINPVAQTSVATESGAPGTLGAMGVVHGRARFAKSFTEHCIIIGLANVRADLNYQNGVDRMFLRRTRYHFYWPALAHIGEQEVFNIELFAQAPSVVDENGDEENFLPFGYQERYAEYRYKPSRVCSVMRSSHSQSLDIWHLAQEFESLPTLSPEFIQDDPPVDRVIAVSAANAPQFIMDAYFRLQCVRPMPVYSVPGLIDHF